MVNKTGITIVGVACGLTLLQVCVATIGRDVGVRQAYARLFAWDSVWYADIAEHGYQQRLDPAHGHLPRTMENRTELSNGGFFPGYPLVASLIFRITPLRIEAALLIAAQLMSVVFWAYLITLLRRLEIRPLWQAGAVAAVFAYPSAYFLVTAYAESTFLACALGFVVWTSARGVKRCVAGALHGVLLTMTRLVGVPLAAYPALRTLLQQERTARDVALDVLLGILAVSGAVGFLMLGARVFGQWDFYLRMEAAGWDRTAQYTFPVRAIGQILFPFEQLRIFTGPMAIENVNLVCATFTLWMLLTLLAADGILAWKTGDAGWRTRGPFQLCAAMMFYIQLAGMVGKDLGSMSRFMLGVHVFLTVAAAHLMSSLPQQSKGRRTAGIVLVVAACLAGLLMQRRLSGRFLTGDFVA